MNVYFVTENAEGLDRDLRPAILNAIQRQFPRACEDPVFSMTYDQAQQIFLKDQDRIYWGRIFNHKVSLSDAYKVEKEMEHLSATFSAPVQPCIFFPQADAVSIDSLRQLVPHPALFEYYVLETETGKSLAVKPVHQESFEKISLEPYSFYRQSRLTRDELGELIDLSCSLKKLELAQ